MLKPSQILSALVAEGSFQGAARQLGVTQSYLSQCVKRYEQRCSAPVIDRNARPLALTEVGKVFLESRLKIEDIEERTQAYCDDFAGLKTGGITVASNGERTVAVLSQAIVRFHRAHPGIAVDLTRDMRLEVIPATLTQGLADVGVLYEHLMTRDLNALPICRERYLLAAPASAESFGVPYNEDGNYPRVEETDCSELGRFGLLQTFAHHERLPVLNRHLPVRLREVPVHAFNLATRLALVAAGLGVAICQEHLIRPNAAKDGCRFASLEGVLPVRQLVIAWNDRRYRSVAAAEFCRLVHESGKELHRPRGAGQQPVLSPGKSSLKSNVAK